MQSVATTYCFVDAARSGCNIKTVYFDTIKNVNKLDIGPPEIVTTEFRKVSTSRMKLVSSMPVPTGIMGEQRQHLVKQKLIVLIYQCSFMLLFETAISSAPNVPPSDHAAPIVVVIDGVRDPGEMGSLLRSASAVGCHVVITMQGLHRRILDSRISCALSCSCCTRLRGCLEQQGVASRWWSSFPPANHN